MKNTKVVEGAKIQGSRKLGRPRKEVKDRKVHVRLEPSVYRMLEAYAATQERTVSTLIRLWTTQRIRELTGAALPD